MKSTVYIETSVVSYYTGRPSRDLIVAARQQQTHDWWNNRIKDFDVFTSKMVLDEAGDGDHAAAQKRLRIIEKFPILDLTENCFILAQKLIQFKAVPQNYPEDALHIAVATINGMDFILTWNFVHINNAETKRKIETTIREYEYECPVICTPEELMGE
ncbi:MAG: type II toxin-antitoxin system VapC family toxin [Candidatus Brocadiaceae bacterium]|nr:type II toxin-antitoxin system VapC family toxin [Candidatus Brocadiaceae bacterium]